MEVNPNPIEGNGSSTNVEDPGALEAVESDISVEGPTFISPVPLAPRPKSPPNFTQLTIPMRWQQASDVSCGVQALGMAFEGLGDGSPTSPAILDFLQNQGMMYDFGTGVEELAFSAQKFGYKGTIPFHNWSLGQLQAELAEGRAPVVTLGANGPGLPGHFVTVTGFSPDGEWVSYNDPILGKQVVAIEKFNRLWGLQGNSGVAVRKTVPAGEFDPVPWVAFVAGLMALISQTPWALRRKGIGGRIISGGSTTRKKTQAVRKPASSDLGGVPNRTAKTISRAKRIRKKKPPKPSISATADPSPQMFNTAPAAEVQRAITSIDEQPPVTDPPTDPDDNLWDKILKILGLEPKISEQERVEYLAQKQFQQAQDELEYSGYLQYLKGLEYEEYSEEQERLEEFEHERRLAEEARERERQRRIFEETEPYEYILQYVYWANGIDVAALVENKEDNVLTEEFINDNSKYPGWVCQESCVNEFSD